MMDFQARGRDMRRPKGEDRKQASGFNRNAPNGEERSHSIWENYLPDAGKTVEEKFSTQLKILEDARSPDSAQAAGRHMSSLLANELPESAEHFLQRLKKCTQGPAWKRELAAEIAEIFVFRLYEPKNPISSGLRSASVRLSRNIRDSKSLFATVVGGLSQLVALLVLALLWPYGQLFKAMDAVFRLVEVSKTNAEFRASTGFERFPYLLEAAVYFIFLLCLGVLCIPFLALMEIVEFIGKIIED